MAGFLTSDFCDCQKTSGAQTLFSAATSAAGLIAECYFGKRYKLQNILSARNG